MSAYVVERIDIAFSVFADDNLEASDVELEPVTGLCQPGLVCDELPFPGEDGTSFKLVHLLRCVPVGRQRPGGILLLLLGWRG